MNLAPYRKSIAALVGAVITWAAATLTDNNVTTSEWIALAVAVATALGVYGTPNEAEVGKQPFKKDGGAVDLLAVLIVLLIVGTAIFLGLAVHPLLFLLLLLVVAVLVV